MASTELRVKELLKERGWTTKVLAEKTGMSESYLTHIKNGTRRWNEDALAKIAAAFNLDPILLFAGQRLTKTPVQAPLDVQDGKVVAAELVIKKVPVMGDIPSYPSAYNNEVMQVTTGYKEIFVPVLGEVAEGTFCLAIENNSMAPRFVRGDQLMVVPCSEVESGQVAAIEYRADKLIKAIMVVSYVEEFVLLESANYKQSPVAMVRGKDPFRIIGKVVSRLQRF